MNTRAEQIEQARRLIATGISEHLKEVLYQQYPELKESEDERIRKGLIEYLESDRDCQPCQDISFYDDAISYLEKQKERESNTEETELNSIAFLEQMGYTCIPPQNQAPVAFTKEDEVMWQNLIGWLEGHFGLLPGGKEKFVAWLKERFVKFAYPKPGWKPSEEQIEALRLAIPIVKNCISGMVDHAEILESLDNDLKKL